MSQAMVEKIAVDGFGKGTLWDGEVGIICDAWASMVHDMPRVVILQNVSRKGVCFAQMLPKLTSQAIIGRRLENRVGESVTACRSCETRVRSKGRVCGKLRKGAGHEFQLRIPNGGEGGCSLLVAV
jgi:hypothetical protein